MEYNTILLLDDDDDDCTLFEDALNEVNSTVELKTANSYGQMMRVLGDPDSELPDLIVMDLNMPAQNGFECLANLKMSEELKHLPVVIFSTSAQREAIDLVYDRGAVLYITKPSTFSELKQIVARLVTLALRGVPCRPARERFLIEL